jgi:hypothetical protein
MQLDASLEQAKLAGSNETHDEHSDNGLGTGGENAEGSDDLPLWTPRIVHIRAAIYRLDAHIIPFVVLKHDPLSGTSFDRETRCIYSGLEQSKDAIRAWWEAPLRALPPEQHYFLVAWSALSSASPRIAPMAGLTFGIATPGPSYKRWITTSALESGGELVAWCEEIDMAGTQEEIIEVVLSEERMLRLMPGQAEHTAEHSSKVA